MNEKQVKKDRNIVKILEVCVDSTNFDKVLRWFLNRLGSKKTCLVVTPNPEIVLQAQKDLELAKIIRQADLSIPDGRGLAWAAKFLYGAKLQVIPGRKLFRKLIDIGQEKGLKIFLLGGKEGVAEKLAFRLQLLSDSYKIQGATGPWLNQDGKPINLSEYQVEKDIVKRINSFAPDFLFVGFGPPKQEKWLARNLPILKVKVAMVVGGAFDYYSGRVPLPPKFFEDAGLEWLWRLMVQPWRIKRIFNAVIVFPLKVIWYKFGLLTSS
jgi:N-acetylglucosaminyldiphosphoundecaprenol N-acetyl-beta-D-mannosaminyltransferase